MLSMRFCGTHYPSIKYSNQINSYQKKCLTVAIICFSRSFNSEMGKFDDFLEECKIKGIVINVSLDFTLKIKTDIRGHQDVEMDTGKTEAECDDIW